MKKICYVVTVSITIKAFFIKQLQYLSRHGYEITVICSYDESLQSLLGDTIKYIPIDFPRGISIFSSIKSVIKLIKIFNKEKFDLIQYSTPNAALYSSISGWINRVKIRNYHLMGLRFEGSSGFMRFILYSMEKLTCVLSTHIECVSLSGLKSSINYKLFKPDKGTVIWNGSTGGVDLDKFNINNKERASKEVRRSLNISDDVIVFGFVGRITKDKGINELIETFKRFLDCNNKACLLIVGDFEEQEKLNSKLLNWAFNCDKVFFIGNVSDVERYYAALDVLVLPSYREGFGNVVIEAEAMGVPVIVSDIPGPIDAMINNETGIVVEVANSQSLYVAMIKMIENSIRETYSNNAVEYVKKNFDSDILCDKILKRKCELLQNTLND